ncbi:MAG TPA: hypothetical protein VF123_08245 [Candidatus Sulfotelmatobacter sp.]
MLIDDSQVRRITVVLEGMVRLEHKDGSVEVRAGQTLIAYAGE